MPLNFPDHTIELTDDLRNKAGILRDFLRFNHQGGHSAIKAGKIIAWKYWYRNDYGKTDKFISGY